MSKKENYRDRKHMILLYPDNDAHQKTLDKIRKSYDYAAILHDRDTWTADDEKENPEHKEGSIKKAHIHVVIRTPNATWRSAICKDLELDEKFCEQIKNIENALQYLVHYNDTEKPQYELDEVFGPLQKRLKESINKLEKSEGEKVVELIEFIRNYNDKLSVTEFASYCAQNGYWSEFRRSGAIFCKIIDEHNLPYIKVEEAEKEARRNRR